MKKNYLKLSLIFIVSLALGFVMFFPFLPELYFITNIFNNSTEMLAIISFLLGALFIFFFTLSIVPFLKPMILFYLNLIPAIKSKNNVTYYKAEFKRIIKENKMRPEYSVIKVVLAALFLPAVASLLVHHAKYYTIADDFLIYNDNSNFFYYRHKNLCDWHGKVIIEEKHKDSMYGIAKDSNGQTIILQGFYNETFVDSDVYYEYTILGYDYNSHLPVLRATFKTVKDKECSELDINMIIERELNLIIRPINKFYFSKIKARLLDCNIQDINHSAEKKTDENIEVKEEHNSPSEPRATTESKPQIHTRAVEKFYPCGACGGSTYCGVCYGSGWVGNPDHECNACYGRKICSYCGGRGGEKTIEYIQETY